MATKRNTLEHAGYLYNPFTTNEIWGQPPFEMHEDSHKQTLQVGQDDSSLPALGDPALRIANETYGTQQPANYRVRTEKDRLNENAQSYLLVFIAVVAAAMYWQR